MVITKESRSKERFPCCTKSSINFDIKDHFSTKVVFLYMGRSIQGIKNNGMGNPIR